MKILLLEDDIFLGDLVQEHLQERGYRVVLSSDGEDAYERIRQEHFDILLLDINVPGIKGSELLRLLREQKINTPTIFITSLNTAKDVKEGFAIGADDYIKKPFEFEELIANLWEDIPTDATIRTYIKMLREHFGESIRTVRGIGYEFILP